MDLDIIKPYMNSVSGEHFMTRGSHRLEKYLKNKYALKSTGKSHKGLEKSLISSIFFRNKHC